MTTKTTYKVGDKVRILDAKKIMWGGGKWDDGDITTVDSLWSDGDPRLVITRGPEKGKAFVVDSSEFEYIEKVEGNDAKMTQFKVGDKAKVTSLQSELVTAVGVQLGDIVEVTYISSGKVRNLRCKYSKSSLHGDGFFSPKALEKISPKLTKNQRITTLEQKVADLQAEVEALKAAQKIAIKTPTMTVKADVDVAKIAESLAKAFEKHTSKSPNEQASANEKRKAIIDEAKAFVEDVQKRDYQVRSTPAITSFQKSVFFGQTDELVFHVNAEKRTVVAIIRTISGKHVVHKGIAKCNPSDVFNADIGKAIALGRALGLDVSKFEKAVQPSEVAVGQVHAILWEKSKKPTGEVIAVGSVSSSSFKYVDGGWASDYQILDDTEAQY